MRENQETPPTMRTPQELAGALGLRPQTVMKFCREGRIRSIRVGKLYRIPAPEFERVLREGVPQLGEELVDAAVATTRQPHAKEVSS